MTEQELFPRIIDLFRKYGVKSVTMDDISRELGISKKTLYQKVKDKKELVEKTNEFEFNFNLTVFEEINSKNLNAIDELLEVHKFIKEQLKYHSHSFDYDLKKYYPGVFQKLHQKKIDVMYNAVLNNIVKGKEEGLYREELHEESIAKLYVARMINVHQDEYLKLNDFLSPEVFREYFIYHIRGLANKKGIDYLEKKMDKPESEEETTLKEKI